MARIYGWDLSHYDWDRGPVDLAAAVRAGISFMTHKATEGLTYQDPRFDDFISRARAAQVPLIGAYMVLVPGADPARQADAFLARLDAVWSGWRDGAFILQVDSEKFSYMSRAPSPSEVKTCCNRLWQATGGRYRPVVYAPQWGYRDTLLGLGYPLWESEYGSNPAVDYRTGYPGDSSARWAPYSGQVPAILQYGSRLTIGSQTQCDANAYRGTVADLTNLVSPGMGVDAVAQEDDMNDTQDAKLNAIYGWVQQMLTMDLKPENSLAYWLRQVASGVDTANTALTEDAVRDKAMLAAFQAMVAGGTSVDTAAVIGAVHELRDEFGPQLADLRARAERAEAERDQLKARLAQAFSGESAPSGQG